MPEYCYLVPYLQVTCKGKRKGRV